MPLMRIDVDDEVKEAAEMYKKRFKTKANISFTKLATEAMLLGFGLMYKRDELLSLIDQIADARNQTWDDGWTANVVVDTWNLTHPKAPITMQDLLNNPVLAKAIQKYELKVEQEEVCPKT